MDEINSGEYLWDRQVHWKIWVYAKENGDEVCIPRPYSSLYSVTTMSLGRGKLELDVLFIKIVDECCGALIV